VRRKGVGVWGNDDPLFPATRVALGATRQFEAAGLERAHWSSAEPIRKVFREAFERADLPYFNPHSFRNTLVRLALERCKTAEEFKAWSQNVGHEQALTTFLNYGTVASDRQGEILRGLAAPQQAVPSDAEAFAGVVVKMLRDSGVDMLNATKASCLASAAEATVFPSSQSGPTPTSPLQG
jgi:hypothetical protein